jgi:hypothetical protein
MGVWWSSYPSSMENGVLVGLWDRGPAERRSCRPDHRGLVERWPGGPTEQGPSRPGEQGPAKWKSSGLHWPVGWGLVRLAVLLVNHGMEKTSMS